MIIAKYEQEARASEIFLIEIRIELESQIHELCSEEASLFVLQTFELRLRNKVIHQQNNSLGCKRSSFFE